MSRAGALGVGGPGFAADAVTTSRGRLRLGTDGGFPSTVRSFPLVTEGLPKLRVWAWQTAPLVLAEGATVTLEFTVRPTAAGDVSADEWLPLVQSVVLAPGNTGQVIFDVEFPASKIRIKAVAAEGDPDTTIEYVLAANA